MDSGINYILEIMEAFGLLGTYSNLLVIGTSTYKESYSLYNHLKKKGFNIDNRPKDNFYDFIYTPELLRVDLNMLLTKLRQGGIILVRDQGLGYNVSVKGKYLQINKAYGIVKNERI